MCPSDSPLKVGGHLNARIEQEGTLADTVRSAWSPFCRRERAWLRKCLRNGVTFEVRVQKPKSHLSDGAGERYRCIAFLANLWVHHVHSVILNK